MILCGYEGPLWWVMGPRDWVNRGGLGFLARHPQGRHGTVCCPKPSFMAPRISPRSMVLDPPPPRRESPIGP